MSEQEFNFKQLLDTVYMIQYLVDLHAQYIEKYGKDVMTWPPEAFQKYGYLLEGLNR